jgi:Pyruvate/2-oxoacid:ferredoxin oxidoreductase delta subunit
MSLFTIDANACVECGQCRLHCPLPGAIIINQDYQHVIVNDNCSGCGLCEVFCPVPGAVKRLEAVTQDAGEKAERSRLLRRVVWRAKWHYHHHPLMGPLTLEARNKLRRWKQAERQASWYPAFSTSKNMEAITA